MLKLDPNDPSSGFWIPIALCLVVFFVLTACGVGLVPSAAWAAGAGVAAALILRLVKRSLFASHTPHHEDE
ncbi:hypothetical protein V2W30_40030 (plasmid) [Streptomyces sp. Q6]|uniref:Uncharacterized protein n=1 Tax=Streptomyces citrinus TaxID=3118173 RepID=A0ACD5AQA5_9ACTN